MQGKGKYYITTAITYTSGKPHIGNCYEIILADAIARYQRADGYDVHFLTGSDEHGQKIETRAIEEGKTPKEFVDATAAVIKTQWDLMNTSYDRFIRTTDADHELQIDADALRDLGCRYLFSRIELSNAEEKQLTKRGVYTDESSPYTVYVYELK